MRQKFFLSLQCFDSLQAILHVLEIIKNDNDNHPDTNRRVHEDMGEILFIEFGAVDAQNHIPAVIGLAAENRTFPAVNFRLKMFVPVRVQNLSDDALIFGQLL